MERLRCNACSQYFTADLPSEVLDDGEPNQKYYHSAHSPMALDNNKAEQVLKLIAGNRKNAMFHKT